jgi:hypothetical protein
MQLSHNQNMHEAPETIIMVIISSALWLLSFLDVPMILKDHILPVMAILGYTVAILKALNLMPDGKKWFQKKMKRRHEKDYQD